MKTYLYLFVMAATTYLIRVLPLTLIRKPIQNPFLRSFLFYVPYVTLAVMTFPAIMNATQSPIAGAAAMVIGIVAAWCGLGLLPVSLVCCATVLILEHFIVSKSCKTPSADFPRRVFLCIHSTFSSPTEKKYSTFSLTFLPITRIRAMEYASS